MALAWIKKIDKLKRQSDFEDFYRKWTVQFSHSLSSPTQQKKKTQRQKLKLYTRFEDDTQ